jgi:hypothetical protein
MQRDRNARRSPDEMSPRISPARSCLRAVSSDRACSNARLANPMALLTMSALAGSSGSMAPRAIRKPWPSTTALSTTQYTTSCSELGHFSCYWPTPKPDVETADEGKRGLWGDRPQFYLPRPKHRIGHCRRSHKRIPASPDSLDYLDHSGLSGRGFFRTACQGEI